MVDQRTLSKGKKRKSDEAGMAERTERRFAPRPSTKEILSIAGVIVGGFGVGAGAFGHWVASPPIAAAPWLALGGVAALAAVLLRGDAAGTALRIGDGGVAWEREGKITRRVPWCDMQGVGIRDGVARIEVEGETLAFGVNTNLLAAAWLVAEAQTRIPSRCKFDKSAVQALPKTSPEDGERFDVEAFQVTGRACRASNRPITFERDAFFCPSCGEIYLREARPKKCLTCEASFQRGSKSGKSGSEK